MEETIEEYLSSSKDQDSFLERESKVISFCEANCQTFSFDHINASLRQDFIRCLIDDLKSVQQRSESLWFNYTAHCLEALRVLSRDKSNLGEMISEKSCLIFLSLAGLHTNSDSQSSPLGVEIVISRSVVIIEALKCICNLVYQNAEFREHVVRYDCTKAVCRRLAWFGQTDLPRDVKFFDLRLLFVLTALEANERTAALHANAVELLTAALDQLIPGREERKALFDQEEVARDNEGSELATRYTYVHFDGQGAFHGDPMPELCQYLLLWFAKSMPEISGYGVHRMQLSSRVIGKLIRAH